MGSIFKRGYEAVKEEKERQDALAENRGKTIFRFFLQNDGDEADVRFLTETPITFYEHTIKGVRNGKEVFSTQICIGENCPLCDKGDKPSFKGAFLMWDNRPFSYKDKEGKEVSGVGQLRQFVQGARVLSQLDRISARYGLAKRDITIARSGKGTLTNYIIERGEESKLSKEEITNMLPEKLRETFDGTMESLYGIVEDQLTIAISEVTGTINDDDEEDAPKKEYTKNVIGVDDDEDEATDNAPLTMKKPLFKKK